MTSIDQLLGRARESAQGVDAAPLGANSSIPRLRVAVVTCMDARIDVYRVLGLSEGEAHVLRNAGGVITDDVIRSLTISQRLLTTREIMLIHHADCGMRAFSDDQFKAEIETDTGIRPPWSPEAFIDPVTDVRQSINRLAASPFPPHRDEVRGFVYDEQTRELTEVS